MISRTFSKLSRIVSQIFAFDREYLSLTHSFEGVSIRLRFSVSAPLSVVPLTNMYFGTFLKNYYPDSFEIFSIFRGHRCHQNVKILRESDEGIFRGGGWEEKFSTPYISLTGGRGSSKFLHTLGPSRALMSGT